MTFETAVALAAHARDRADALDVARLILSAASFAQAAGEASLRDQLVERAAECLEVPPNEAV